MAPCSRLPTIAFDVPLRTRRQAAHARRERTPLERAEERDAGNAARFVAQRRPRGGEPARASDSRAPRSSDLFARDDRDAAIERAADERKRRLDPAEHLDDHVERLREEGVGIGR